MSRNSSIPNAIPLLWLFDSNLEVYLSVGLLTMYSTMGTISCTIAEADSACEDMIHPRPIPEEKYFIIKRFETADVWALWGGVP